MSKVFNQCLLIVNTVEETILFGIYLHMSLLKNFLHYRKDTPSFCRKDGDPLYTRNLIKVSVFPSGHFPIDMTYQETKVPKISLSR